MIPRYETVITEGWRALEIADANNATAEDGERYKIRHVGYGYVVEYCRGRNTESAKAMVTALRSLLRFLHVTGRAPGPLVGAVPAVANWRLAGLPRRLSAGQVGALIDGCDTDTAVGVRDRALLVMLARLGLRTAEAAAVRLEDVNWRFGS